MLSVLDYIEEQQRAFAQLPFFVFLRDREVPPGERFVFAPAAAPFIMAFADFNRSVLYQPGATDPLQQVINVHSREDDTHFRMYLDDLETLGYDAPMRFSRALKFLWSDDRRNVRRTCYLLAALHASVSTPLRMVVVEAVEATGAVAFATFAAAADEYEAATGHELRYFGRRHEKMETGHAVGSDNVEGRLRAMHLSAPERARARELVDEVFRSFTAMMNEVGAYVAEARKPRTVSWRPGPFDAAEALSAMGR